MGSADAGRSMGKERDSFVAVLRSLAKPADDARAHRLIARQDRSKSGCLTKVQWANGLKLVLQLDLPFLSYLVRHLVIHSDLQRGCNNASQNRVVIRCRELTFDLHAVPVQQLFVAYCMIVDNVCDGCHTLATIKTTM